MANSVAQDMKTVSGNFSGMGQAMDREVASPIRSLGTDLANSNGMVGSFARAASESDKQVLGLGDAFSHTRGAVSGLTGGLAGFVPMLAGLGLTAAADKFGNLAQSIQHFQSISGMSAQDSSKWIGATSQMGISSTTLSVAIRSLNSNILTYQDALSKQVVSTAAVKAAEDKVAEAENAHQIAIQSVTEDQIKLNDAIDKYGKGSTEAISADNSLISAHSKVLTTADALIKAQSDLSTITSGASEDTTKMEKAAHALGISLTDQNGKMVSANQLLMEMADAYQKSTDKEQAAADITAVLGGRSTQLLPLLEQGASGIQKLMDNTAHAGEVLDQAQVKAGMSSYIAMNDIKMNLEHIFNQLGEDAVPVIDYLAAHVNTIERVAAVVVGLYGVSKGVSLLHGLYQDMVDIVKIGGHVIGTIEGIAQKLLHIDTPQSAADKAGGASTGKLIPGGMQSVFLQEIGPGALGELEDLMRGGTGLGGGGFGKGASAADREASSAETVLNDAGDVGMMSQIMTAFRGTAAGGYLLDTLLPMVTAAAPFVLGAGAIAFLAWAMTQKVDMGTKEQQKAATENVQRMKDSPYGVRFSWLGGVDTGKKKSTDESEEIIWQSAKTVANQWLALADDAVGTARQWSNWQQDMTPLLSKILSKNSDIAAAEVDISMLMRDHKITTAKQLAQYENDWNSLQKNAKDAADAQSLFAQMVAQGQVNMNTQGPAFTKAWNQLLAEGLNPAAISASEIATQMKLNAALSVLMHTDLQAANAQIGNINSTGGALGGKGSSQHGSTGKHTLAGGGMITEPVLGIGLMSGDTWSFAETASEMVVPMSGSGGAVGGWSGGGSMGGQMVNIDLRGAFVLQPGDIDKLVTTIGNRIAQSLLPRAGVNIRR